MISRISLLFLAIFITRMVTAFELKYAIENHLIFVELTNITYPEYLLTEEIKNGLPNKVDGVLKLLQRDELIKLVIINYDITYDLWEESYLIRVNGSTDRTPILLKEDDEINHFLSVIRFPPIPQSLIEADYSDILLTAEIAFNPIQSEKLKKIEDWMRKKGEYNQNITAASTTIEKRSNSFFSRGGNSTRDGIFRSSGPRFKNLFDQILTEYMENSASNAALWRSDTVQKRLIFDQADIN